MSISSRPANNSDDLDDLEELLRNIRLRHEAFRELDLSNRHRPAAKECAQELEELRDELARYFSP